MSDTHIMHLLMSTKDPTVLFDGTPVPAMSVMLHRVCGDDTEKFDEALRLVGLFIAEALKAGEARE